MGIPQSISEGRHRALRNALPAVCAVEVDLDRDAATAAAAGGANHRPLTTSDLCRGSRESLEFAGNAGRNDPAGNGRVLAFGAAASVQVTGWVQWRGVRVVRTARTLIARVSAVVVSAVVSRARAAFDAGVASGAGGCTILRTGNIARPPSPRPPRSWLPQVEPRLNRSLLRGSLSMRRDQNESGSQNKAKERHARVSVQSVCSAHCEQQRLRKRPTKVSIATFRHTRGARFPEWSLRAKSDASPRRTTPHLEPATDVARSWLSPGAQY